MQNNTQETIRSEAYNDFTVKLFESGLLLEGYTKYLCEAIDLHAQITCPKEQILISGQLIKFLKDFQLQNEMIHSKMDSFMTN